jgi:hypothetical protein
VNSGLEAVNPVEISVLALSVQDLTILFPSPSK